MCNVKINKKNKKIKNKKKKEEVFYVQYVAKSIATCKKIPI